MIVFDFLSEPERTRRRLTGNSSSDVLELGITSLESPPPPIPLRVVHPHDPTPFLTMEFRNRPRFPGYQRSWLTLNSPRSGYICLTSLRITNKPRHGLFNFLLLTIS